MTTDPPRAHVPRSPEDRIRSLARSDKWFLGGLDGLVWAPPFPAWLDKPGFWDPGHLLHYEVGPLFTVAFLDRSGTELPLTPATTASGDTWQPDRMKRRWRLEGIPGELVEEGRVLPGGVLESRWTLPADLPAWAAVAFTAQPGDDVDDVRSSEAGIRWSRRLTDRKGRHLEVGLTLESRSPADRRGVVWSKGSALPSWEHGPFSEGGMSKEGTVTHPGRARTGWAWMAVGSILSSEQPLVFRMVLDAGAARVAEVHEIPTDWPAFFGDFPDFRCEDPYLDRYFDARIHGMGLNRIDGVWDNIRHPAVAEGIEYFHVPITYSAQCHMMEMRWHRGGREAWGSILNFLARQKEDGSLHGRLYPNHLEGTDYYHANWGDAVRAVHAVHPDPDRLATCYDGLTRFAGWMVRERDPEGSGMFTVVNHYETGQEYMSRYLAVDPEADVNEWQPRLRLKGIDVTVYAYQLFKALTWMARRLGRDAEGAEWDRRAEHTGRAINDLMWSPVTGLFGDVDGTTGARTGIKAAVGFYPLLTDLVDDERIRSLLDHLENPGTFGTPYPIPSSSVDDPHFSAEGLWKGKRHNCPWNGRVWPMTTSHVIEGLLRCWRRGHHRAGLIAARMIPKYVEMMFDGGDVDRPNCYEHYNPYTGHPCYFRGINDYQHSWVLDLLVRGVAGLGVDEEGLHLHPLPHEITHVSLGPVHVRGHAVSVQLDATRARMFVGERGFDIERGGALQVSWQELGGPGR